MEWKEKADKIEAKAVPIIAGGAIVTILIAIFVEGISDFKVTDVTSYGAFVMIVLYIIKTLALLSMSKKVCKK